jgi:flagellar hook-associated protein 3 FlgL
MRVTHASIAKNVLANLQGNINRMSETQQRLSSGKQINRPSDSPTGTVSAMELRSAMAAQQQYARNAEDGVAWLNVADAALQSVDEKVTRARSLVLEGMSAGSSAQSRQALAVEIRELSEAIRSDANTSYLNRPVFGGTSATAEAYTQAGGFNGDGAQVMRTVGANTKMAINVDGKAVFGDGDDSIFKVLSDVATKLEQNDADTLSGDLDRLDQRATTIRVGLSTVGSRTNQLERMRQSADDMVRNVSQSLSDVEDIDLPQTITELQLQQTAYQAALASGARVVQPSLIDFLR